MFKKAFVDGFNNTILLFRRHLYFIVICLILTTGVFARFEALFLQDFFDYDDILLAQNLWENTGFMWAFRPLINEQVAPLAFLVSSKIITDIFGLSTYTFRFLPFLASILSIFAFYFLSKKILPSKTAIILANFLFSINFILISYGIRFKQYSGDLLIFILVLIWISSDKNYKNLENLDLKGVLKYSLIFTVLFFVSQTTIFILFGAILYHIIKNFKNYKVYLIPAIPLIVILIYKHFATVDFAAYMDYYWKNGFISISNFPSFIKENLVFYTFQGKFLLLLIPFMFGGFILSIFSKNRIEIIFLLAFLGHIIASILHIYPLLGRTALYLLPFFIIFIAKCVDFLIEKLSFKNKTVENTLKTGLVSFLVILILLFNLSIFCKSRKNAYQDHGNIMAAASFLKEHFNRETDYLIMPGKVCKVWYSYYDKYLGINIDEERIVLTRADDNESFKRNIEKLDKGDNKDRYYWVFITGYFSNRPYTKYYNAWTKGDKKALIMGEIKLGKKVILAKFKFI